MTFKTSYNAGLGQPAINLAGVDTVARVAIGTVLKGFDDLLGEAEFIYLPGVASTVAGDCVIYDLAPAGPTTARTLSGTHLNTGAPVAWASAAILAGQYGWYQISGLIVATGIAGGIIGRCFLTTTAGAVDDTAIAGAQVLGAKLSSAIGTPAAGQVYVTAQRPFIQGQIT